MFTWDTRAHVHQTSLNLLLHHIPKHSSLFRLACLAIPSPCFFSLTHHITHPATTDMPQRKWCCHSHDRSQSPDSPNVRHPILSKRALRNKPSSLDTPSYDDSDIQLSFLVPGRLSDDSGILPDPRDLTSDASPTTTTNPGSLTPTAMAMKLRQRMSRDSTTFNVIRQQRKLQKKSRRILKSKESTIDLDDLVGLHLATRTPSRGGYDADARLFTESALLASVEENQVSLERRNARVVTPPPRQQRYTGFE